MGRPDWLFASSTDQPIVLHDPADPESTTSHPVSTADDVDAAVAAAAGAWAGWRHTLGAERARVLDAIAAALQADADDLAATMTAELGKPRADSLGEIANAAGVFEFYAAAARTRTSAWTRSISSADDLMSVRCPLGVVAAVTPWNFPINLAAVKIAPALAFGNTVVLKPSPQATASTHALLRTLHSVEALPAGVVTLVQGDGGSAVSRLVADPAVSAISFTGSTAVGLQVLQLAARHRTPAQCEMGGKNPAVVLADADLELAARTVVDGAFRLAGQRCTATSRVIVEAPVYDAFVARLVAMTEDVAVGPPQGDVLVGPLVNAERLDAVTSSVEAAIADGATVLVGGGPRADLAGYYFAPTVLATGADAPIAVSEVFGPVLTVHRAADLDAALALANGTDYGLSAAVFTNRLDAAQRFVDEVDAGGVSVNGSTAGWQYQQGLGGWKDSGAGPPEQGAEAELFFTRLKTVRVSRAAAR